MQAFLAKIAKSVQYFKVYKILTYLFFLCDAHNFVIQVLEILKRQVKLRLSDFPNIMMLLVVAPPLKPGSFYSDSDDFYGVFLHSKKAHVSQNSKNGSCISWDSTRKVESLGYLYLCLCLCPFLYLLVEREIFISIHISSIFLHICIYSFIYYKELCYRGDQVSKSKICKTGNQEQQIVGRLESQDTC